MEDFLNIENFNKMMPTLSEAEQQRFNDNRLGFRASLSDGRKLEILPHASKGFWFVVLTDTETGIQDYTEKGIRADFVAFHISNSLNIQEQFQLESFPYEPTKSSYFVEPEWLRKRKEK